MDNLNKLFLAGLILTLALTACSRNSGQAGEVDTGSEPEISAGMLQHNVYFYLNEDVTDEQRAQFEEGLKKLLSIDEVHHYQIGVPGQTEEREVTDHSFGYSFFSWFKNLEDYKVYAEHPVHLDFIDTYEELWTEVRVYDSELIATP